MDNKVLQKQLFSNKLSHNKLFVDHLDHELVEKAISNTISVANKVEEYLILGTYKMPEFPVPNGYNSPIEYLREVSNKGLLEKLKVNSIIYTKWEILKKNGI